MTRDYGTIKAGNGEGGALVAVQVVHQRVNLATQGEDGRTSRALLTREQAWGLMSWLRDAVYDLDAQAYGLEEDRCAD